MDLIPYLGAIVGITGIVVGAIISPKIAHQIQHQYSRGEVIFNKKLEYFENVLDTIEKNKKVYSLALKKLECSKKQSEVKGAMKQLKEERAHFSAMSSPLYLDVRRISERIIRFVRVEGIIFSRIAGLTTKNKKEMDLILAQLEEDLRILSLRGEEVLFEMRKELNRK